MSRGLGAVQRAILDYFDLLDTRLFRPDAPIIAFHVFGHVGGPSAVTATELSSVRRALRQLQTHGIVRVDGATFDGRQTYVLTEAAQRWLKPGRRRRGS